jgi:hypothetical protein
MPITAAGQQAVKNDAFMATSPVHVMATPWDMPGHIQLALIQPRKPTQPATRRSRTTVARFAKGSAKRLGRQADSQMLRPATRNGLGLIVWGLLASARQQIAQGWQGSPGSQAVDDKEMNL